MAIFWFLCLLNDCSVAKLGLTAQLEISDLEMH